MTDKKKKNDHITGEEAEQMPFIESDIADSGKAEGDEIYNSVFGEQGSGQFKVRPSRKETKREEQFKQSLMRAKRYYPDHLKGLTLEQLEERTVNGYVNKAVHSTAKTYRNIFFTNIFTFFNLLCVVVAAALVYVNSYKDLMFLFIMGANMVIGIVTEIRSKLAIDRLSLISAPVAFVIRGGEQVSIPPQDVVLDDIMFLESGKHICADSIIVNGAVDVNEAMLTGESQLVKKQEGDVLYAGSFIAGGKCYARADKIGNANYIEGLTSYARKYRKARSELIGTMKRLIQVIGVLLLPLAVMLIWINNGLTGDLQKTIQNVSGAVIGMIPAGMFFLTSTALAVSGTRLSQNRVLVQDMYCIEMLARTDVLCLDKTGTITDGTMRVSFVHDLRRAPEFTLNDILGSMLAATGDNNQTATALVSHFGYSKEFTSLVSVPFTSDRKFSAVNFEDHGTYFLGAPEFIMGELDKRLEAIVGDKARQGLRVLLLAHSPSDIRGGKLPGSRRALAVIALEDHIRDDACSTIGWFKENGVAVKVISGDNPQTVAEVARRAGIENSEQYISLDGLSDREVVEIANQYTVFGRVTPEQKSVLIRAIKAHGKTVAMTGDGVNDILALKEADCSIAMAAGSEAARKVSHLVLMDSDFSNMPKVVYEGRKVINNIQKSASLYLMKTLFCILLAVITLFMNIEYPFRPGQMLLLEMFVIGAPSLLLAFQSNNNKIQGHFLTNVLKNSIPSALTLVLGFLALYVFSLSVAIPPAQMNAMGVIVITFIGWVILVRLCRPFDLYRFAVCVMSVGLIALMFVFMPSYFDIVKLDMINMLISIIIIQSAYVVVSCLTFLLKKLKAT